MLTFTCEFKPNSLPFLDILVERTNFGMQALFYRKPMFTRPYTRRKINLIKTLVHSALICSKPKLANELDFIKMTLLKNGYPEVTITNTIRYKCLQFSIKPNFGPERCPLYLRLLWHGKASMQLLEQIKSCQPLFQFS